MPDDPCTLAILELADSAAEHTLHDEGTEKERRRSDRMSENKPAAGTVEILDFALEVRAGPTTTAPTPTTPSPAPPETAASSTPAPTPAAAKRPTLFDLEAEFLSILVVLDDGGEIPDETIDRLAQRLQEVDDALDKKIEGWGCWIRQLEADAIAPKSEGQRLQKRGLGYEKFAGRLRSKLKDVLNAVEKQRVKAPRLTVSLKAGQPKIASVVIDDLPAKFLLPPPPPPKPQADEEKILAEFKRSGGVPPGVTIVVSEWDEKKSGPKPTGIVVDASKKVLEIR